MRTTDPDRTPWRWRLALHVMPKGSVYGQFALTGKGHSWLHMQAARAAGGAAIVIGLLLIALFDVSVVAASGGALVSLGATWTSNAKRQHERRTEVTRSSVEELARFDFLHARLNHLATKLGARTIDLTAGEQDSALRVRAERIAHLSGAEEYRPVLEPNDPGWQFWDQDAYGTAR